jgi:NADH-quinone oxidoreductase subunit M
MQSTMVETVAMWLIVVAALMRKGIVPFHAWVPEVFDHGRMGPAILFNAPQVGAYITVVLIVPRASPEMLRTIALLALGTAVYGAALALVQRSARRACGYLFMSQSALVMAGLDCTSVTALAGGLLVWLSAGLGFAGLARCVLVLEARRGRLDLTSYHGGYDRMPVLAVSFLAMGLACTGFPGTLGFVGQELLVDGAVGVFPVMGFAVVIASALTGLAVLRMYFSLFCGGSDVLAHRSLRLGLRPREAWTFMALVIALIGFGLVPRPLVDSRFEASDEILRLRQERMTGSRSNTPALVHRISWTLGIPESAKPVLVMGRSLTCGHTRFFLLSQGGCMATVHLVSRLARATTSAAAADIEWYRKAGVVDLRARDGDRTRDVQLGNLDRD